MCTWDGTISVVVLLLGSGEVFFCTIDNETMGFDKFPEEGVALELCNCLKVMQGSDCESIWLSAVSQGALISYQTSFQRI